MSACVVFSRSTPYLRPTIEISVCWEGILPAQEETLPFQLFRASFSPTHFPSKFRRRTPGLGPSQRPQSDLHISVSDFLSVPGTL